MLPGKLSKNNKSMWASEIRELMKLAGISDIISFAGGMPDRACLPCNEIQEIVNSLSSKQKASAYQYGATSALNPWTKEEW